LKRPTLALVSAFVFLLAPAPAVAETWSWLAYGGDTQLTNDVAASSFTPENVSSTHRAWSVHLDGAV